MTSFSRSTTATRQSTITAGSGNPGLEQMWDDILTHGKLIYGIAVDDAHHFKGEFSRDRANPGRGWIVVRAAELSPLAILEAMESGDFYASTGVTLSDYEANGAGDQDYHPGSTHFQVHDFFHWRGGARTDHRLWTLASLPVYGKREIRASESGKFDGLCRMDPAGFHRSIIQ